MLHVRRDGRVGECLDVEHHARRRQELQGVERHDVGLPLRLRGLVGPGGGRPGHAVGHGDAGRLPEVDLGGDGPDSTTVSTGATAYRQSFTFDWLGNRATLTEHDPADAAKNVTFTYGYGNSEGKQPHTLGWIGTNPTGQGSSYQYDAVGNTTVRDLSATTQNLTWTQENKPATITDDGTTTKYVYDANGNRLLENSPSGSTLYLGETEVTTDATGTIVRASRAYVHPGAPTVVRSTSNGATTGHKRNVMLADHLGTANTTVDVTSAGQPVTRRAFKPYGEVRGPKPTSWPNKRSYLGVGIDDAGTGLTHIGAREYDQGAGRFISADPIIDIADPIQMNGYAYSNNSPVSRSDPSGLMIDGAGDCGAIGTCNVGSKPEHIKNNPDGKLRGGDDEGWVESNTPSSTDAREAASQYYGHGSNKLSSTYGGYWTPQTSVFGKQETVCYGRLACNHAYAYFLENPNDTAGAKHVAATYCLSHADKCAQDARVWERTIELGNEFVAAAGMGRGGLVGRSLAAGCKCFLAGTDVLMSDGKTKNIEDVELGDKVLATDPETGETGLREVTRLIRTDGDKYFNELSIATPDGMEHLTATHEHPFWSPSEGSWVPAGDLRPGTTLRTDDASIVVVTGNRGFTKHVRTYNLTVDDLHTYYVLAGSTPVLVHNSNCGPASTFNVPEQPGVYTIHLNDGTKYVGMSTTNINSRVAASMRSKHAVGSRGYGPADVENVTFFTLPSGVKATTARRIEQTVMEGLKSRGVTLLNRRDPEIDIPTGGYLP